MAKTSLPLRTELDGVWYLESHPQVAEYFKTAQVFDYCERLTSFNQPLAEAFAQSYNGRTIKFGPAELIQWVSHFLSIASRPEAPCYVIA